MRFKSVLTFIAVAATVTTLVSPIRSAPVQTPKTTFAIVFFESPRAFADRTGPNAKQYWADWTQFIGSIQAAGTMTGSGIQPPSTGKRLGVPAKGDTPQVSGFVTLEADRLEDVLQLVKSCPALKSGGAVDVRPLLPMQNAMGDRS